jgi:hypothetical protein
MQDDVGDRLSRVTGSQWDVCAHSCVCVQVGSDRW